MPETLVHSFADVVVIRIYYIFCFYVVIKWRRQATMAVAIESFTASDDEANFWFVHPCQAFIPAIHPSIVNHILCHTMCVRTNQREWFLYITFFTFLFLYNFRVFFNIFPVVELVERLLLLFLHHFMFSSWLVLFANLILFNHSLLYLLLHGFQVLQLFFLLLFYFSRALLLELGGFFVVIKKQWNGVEQLKVVYKSGYRWFLVLTFFTIHNLHIIFNLMIYKIFL